MSVSPVRPLHLRDSLPSLAAALLIVICATTARAQMGGIDTDPGDRGTGGRNRITGSVYLPGGRRLDRRAKVNLQSSLGLSQFTLTDDTGAFSFPNLRGGTYTISIDAGKEFDVATETVDIIDPSRRLGDPGTSISVHITLQARQAASPGVVGTVDAATAGVPDDARDLYKQALESVESGDRKKAIEQLNKALAIFPNFMAALNELGLQYLNLKQYDKAVDALRQALKIAPEAFTPRLNYGIVLLHMKDYKAAAVELRHAVDKDSSSAAARLHLGRAFISLGNYNAAEKELQQAISLDESHSAEAHRYLGAVYIEKRDNRRAAEELEKYLKLSPKAKDADRIRDIISQLRTQASN